MRRVAILCVAVTCLGALAACGSSKPGYCSARTDLENSIKGLTSLNTSSGVSGLQAQLKKIGSSATTLVNQAKSDFPSQASALSSSITALEGAVRGLPANPSASQIASVTKDAAAVLTSAKSFLDASNSKCS